MKSRIFRVVGDPITLDGIDCTIIYMSESLNFAVDNHGCGYYIDGTEDTAADSPSNSFMWGEYKSEPLYGTPGDIGTGLQNSNEALQYSELVNFTSSNYITIWKALSNRRQETTDQWFVPSSQELFEVYKHKDVVPNLNTGRERYWSSSSDYGPYANYVFFYDGTIYWRDRTDRYRCRLCRTF